MQNFMGMDNFVWWMGIVENRIDPLKVGRCQVRIFAWNTADKSYLPTEQLLWAHPMLPLNSDVVQPPKEGVMVFGFFMDGPQAQTPIMMGQLPGIPDTTTDPSQGFSDPRTNEQLQAAPRPPQSINYNTSGSGVTINEAPNAHRYPIVLNEPTTSRIGRNENIQDTIVQSKIDSTLLGVPVATGSIEVRDVDVEAFLGLQISLPTLTIPPFSIGINKALGFEICGIGINAALSAGFNFSGLTLGFPTILIGGEILIGGIPIDIILSGLAALGAYVNISIDLFGCILAGLRVGGNILIDGGIALPLIQFGKIINFRVIGRVGTVYGGVSLGTLGGIPMSTTPMWDEPVTPYAAVYPYNPVMHTESGHVFELDDTPGAERIHTYHRSGTFQEMHPDGSMVTKVTANNFSITMADDNTNVMGNEHTTVNQDQTNNVQGNHMENITGNETYLVNGNKTHTVLGTETRTTAKDFQHTMTQNRFVDVKGNDNILVEGKRNVTILGDCNIIVKGSCTLAVREILNLGSTGDTNLTVGGNYNVNVTGAVNLNAGTNYTLNSPAAEENIGTTYTLTAGASITLTAPSVSIVQ